MKKSRAVFLVLFFSRCSLFAFAGCRHQTSNGSLSFFSSGQKIDSGMGDE
jgi:hypothetical protein